MASMELMGIMTMGLPAFNADGMSVSSAVFKVAFPRFRSSAMDVLSPRVLLLIRLLITAILMMTHS
jgi:hypothetical protein